VLNEKETKEEYIEKTKKPLLEKIKIIND